MYLVLKKENMQMETQGTVDSIKSSNILVCCTIGSNIFEFQKEKQDNEINKRNHG